MKQVNVETFMNEMSAKSFCSIYDSNPSQLREQCNDLGKSGLITVQDTESKNQLTRNKIN